MKKFLFNTINVIYRQIFFEDMSLNIRSFVKDLVFVGSSFGISALCIFLFQIFAGRILGPEEYGKYAIVDSISIFMQILMTGGVTIAVIKSNMERKGEGTTVKQAISTSYFLVLALSSTTGILFFLFSDFFSGLFSVSVPIFNLAVLMGISFSFYTLATDNLRGLYKMEEFGIFRIIYGSLAILALLLFVFLKAPSFEAAIFSLIIAYLAVFVIATLRIRKNFVFRLDLTLVRNFLSYGFYAAIGGVSFTLLPALNRLILNKYLSIQSIGIYSAYYFASVSILFFFSKILIAVFFPAASQRMQKGPIFIKIGALLPYLFLIGVPVLFGVNLMIVFFYGREYPLNAPLALLFAFTSILLFAQGLYYWLFCSAGMRGVKLGAVASVIMIAADLALNIIFVPYFKIYGSVIAMGFAYLIGIVFMLFLRNKVIHEE